MKLTSLPTVATPLRFAGRCVRPLACSAIQRVAARRIEPWLADWHVDAGVHRLILIPYRYQPEQVEIIAREILPRLT